MKQSACSAVICQPGGREKKHDIMLCYVNTNLYSALGGTPSSYQLRFTIAAAKANHHSVFHVNMGKDSVSTRHFICMYVSFEKIELNSNGFMLFMKTVKFSSSGGSKGFQQRDLIAQKIGHFIKTRSVHKIKCARFLRGSNATSFDTYF